MADNHTKERAQLQYIKNPEHKQYSGRKGQKVFIREGISVSKNVKSLPGCPDIVLPKYKTVIFVNGCFWHKHDCPRFVWPSSNKEYWEPKIRRNVERDKINIELLQKEGWRVLVVWECELKKNVIEERLSRLCLELQNPVDSD